MVNSQYKNRNSFYASKDWRKLRDYQLTIEPTCRQCRLVNQKTTPASEVDHIIPLWENPELALSYENLQSLCWSCHVLKTKTDTANYIKKYRKTKQGKLLNKRYEL